MILPSSSLKRIYLLDYDSGCKENDRTQCDMNADGWSILGLEWCCADGGMEGDDEAWGLRRIKLINRSKFYEIT